MKVAKFLDSTAEIIIWVMVACIFAFTGNSYQSVILFSGFLLSLLTTAYKIVNFSLDHLDSEALPKESIIAIKNGSVLIAYLITDEGIKTEVIRIQSGYNATWYLEYSVITDYRG